MSLKPPRDSSEARIAVKSLDVLMPRQANNSLKPKSSTSGVLEAKLPGGLEGEETKGSSGSSDGESIELSSLAASTAVYQFEPIQLAQAAPAAGSAAAGGIGGAAAVETGGLIAGVSATTVAAAAAIGVVGVAAASSGGGGGSAQNLPPTFASASIVAPGVAGGAPITGTVKATDPEGSAVSYSIKTQGGQGAATVDAATGAFKYTLTDATKATGTDSFVVTAKDASGQAVDQTVNVSIVNGAPIVSTSSTSSVTGLEDASAITGSVKATDPEGGAIAYSIKSQGAIGSVVLDAASGAFSYKPNADANGSDKFVVTAKDASGSATDQTVTVAISPVNDAPVFATKSVTLSGTEDVAVTGTSVATDIDGPALTYSVKGTGAANGSVTVDAKTGAYTYTPKLDYNGTDSFVVVASDGSLTAEQAVAVTLAAVNDPPQKTALATTALKVAAGETTSFVIDATDVDSPVSSLKATVGTQPVNGKITFGADGNFYTPNPGFTGTDSFGVTLSDGAASSSYVVAVSVVPNLPPVFASPASVTVQGSEDVVVTGAAKATDPEGSALAYSVLTAPANGAVQLNAATGAYTYTPKLDYSGNDSFVVAAKDPFGNVTATGLTVNVVLAAVNDAPVFATKSVTLSGTEDVAVTGTSVATDVDGPALAYSVKGTGAANGSVIVDAKTGAYTYTPKLDYNGTDSFVVVASDGSLTAEQAVTVTLAAVNDAPVFANKSVTLAGTEDVAVTGVSTATDVDGTALTYSIKGVGAANGSVIVDAKTGAYTYTPKLDYNGSDSFIVVASDGSLTDEQAVTVTLAAVNDAPRFAKSSVSVSGTEDTVLTGSVSATDPEGSTVLYSIKSGGSTSGSVQIDGKTGAYTYTPKLDVNGSDSFVVLASDGSASSEQTVNITLAAVNDAPVITSAATVSVNEKVPVSTVVYTATATDVDGPSLTYGLSGADQAAFKINATTGAVTFVASPDFAAKSSYAFSVTASDGSLTATKPVALSVASLATTINLDVDTDGNLNTLEPISLGTGAYRLTDSSSVANAVRVTGLTGDDFFQFGGALTDYSFTYTKSSSTLSVSSNVAGVFSSINIAGVAISSLVLDEPTAETGLATALGVTGGSDFFRFASSGTGGGGGSLDPLTSLDFDSDANLSTVYRFDANLSTTPTVSFTDSSKIASNAAIANFGLTSPGVGDTITVDTSTSSWSFSSSNKTSTGVDIDISYNNAGTVSLIKLVGAASPTSGLINSEATAEQALGYDFFKSSEAVNSNVALDLASGDLSLRTLDAGTASNQYIEDGSKANQVRILNFGSGDTITVVNLGNANYTSTSSGYFSSSGKDILFSNNVNGTASVITLVGAVTTPGLVYDEASAEKAAGFDFISFRFA